MEQFDNYQFICFSNPGILLLLFHQIGVIISLGNSILHQRLGRISKINKSV
jgi:hypothetical protein